MDLNQILNLIEKESEKSQDEIKALMNKKKEELSGLISDMGAAHIVANELGVRVYHIEDGGPKQIKDLAEGMSGIDIVGRVTHKFEPREFETNNRKGSVGNFVIEDETSTVRITLWNDMVKELEKINIGDIVKIKSGYVKKNNMMERIELHLNNRSAITVNPEGVSLPETGPQRVHIKDVQQEGTKIELLGTIVDVYSPRFFEVCPTCNKRVKDEGEGFKCAAHGDITPDYSVVINVLLDDGSGTIRVACFRDQAKQLIENINELREKEDEIEKIKVDLLGQMVIIQGRSKRNTMNNNMECIASLIDKNVNADEELKKLKTE